MNYPVGYTGEINIRELPVGAIFRSLEGKWEGKIVADESGRRGIAVRNGQTFLIPKDYRLFVEIVTYSGV